MCAPNIKGRVASADFEDRNEWVLSHFDGPPEQIEEFLNSIAVSLAGKDVIDIGCGDGLIDLGVVSKFSPNSLIGVDVCQVDVNELVMTANQHLGLNELPENLSFTLGGQTKISLDSESRDLAISWSTFEHVRDLQQIISEVYRILKPQSYFFIQVWPMYYSENGGHLWYWDSTPYSHLLKSRDELQEILALDKDTSDEVKKACMIDYDTLNKLTLKKLTNALKFSGFEIRKLKLVSGEPVIPPSLQNLPVEDLIIAEIKLLAFKN